jgi:PII-like signaling protein
MKGVFLRFYMHENHKHRHVLLHQWLLQQARKQGIHGGTVFRAVAGFGHHGKLHFQHFYELAGELTMQIDFVVTEEEAQSLIDLVQREKIRLFYLKVPAEFGVINPDASDLAESPSEAAR